MLVDCPECKKQVSDQAASCPHCGHPMLRSAVAAPATTGTIKKTPIFLILSVIAFVLSLQTPKLLLFFPLMATLGFAVVSLFRKEKGRMFAILILALTGALYFATGMRGLNTTTSNGSVSGSTAPKITDAAEIVDWNWTADRSFGSDGAVIWNVEVKNKSSRPISLVKLELTTYDKSGKLLDSDYTYISAIAPGQSKSKKSYADYYGTEEKAGVIISEVKFSR